MLNDLPITELENEQSRAVLPVKTVTRNENL
jgi:hypothetical protein